MALLVGLALLLSHVPARGDQALFELRIICPDTYDFRMDYTEMIVDEFAAVGISVTLDFVPMDEVTERCFGSDGKLHKDDGFDVAFFGWRISKATDPRFMYVNGDTIYNIFHSDNSASNVEGDNCMSWENAGNDNLIDKIREEKDEAKLKEYWMQWQELFHDEQPIAPIFHTYVEVEEEECWIYEHISFNLNHPVLKKKLVRQALSHLVPRQKICNLHNRTEKNQRPDTLTSAEPCAVPVNPDHFAFNEDINPYQYDPDLAKELLFRAGYKVKTKKHENAESLLQQAENAFSAFEFQEALDLANQAKLLYEELGDTESLSNVTGAVIPLYQKAIGAETLLNEGTSLKDRGEYETAKQKLLEAKQTFEECGLTQKVSETELLISEIDEILRKQSIIQEADSLFEQGKEAFEKENYEAALDFFQRAKELYASVGSEKAAECDEWIEKTQTEMEKPCLGTIFLAVLIGAGFLVSRRRFR